MIIFTQHALLKLKQRRISQETVRKTLKSPDYKFPSYLDRKIVYKKFGKLYLKVIYRKEERNIIVITQHWEERPKSLK